MKLSYKPTADHIFGGLPKLRLPSMIVDKNLGTLILDTCALCILVVLYFGYRNQIHRLRRRYRPHPVPAYEWLIPMVGRGHKWLGFMAGYARSQVGAGLERLVDASFIAKDDFAAGKLRDSSNRFAVAEYTLLNPALKVPLEPVDPTVWHGNLSLAYRDILRANGLDYFSMPVCVFQPAGKSRPSLFAKMTHSERRLYIVLWWLARQHGSSEFEATVDQLRTVTGFCMATMKKAWNHLEERRLVWNSSPTLRSMRVHLRNPLTGELLRSDGVRTDSDPHNNITNYYDQTSSRRVNFRMECKEAESLFLHLIEEAGISVNPEKNSTEWKFRCPFHQDNSPSCNYNPGKGCFQCFGCGEKGTSYKLFIRLGAIAGTEQENIIRRMAAHLGQAIEYNRPDAEAISIIDYCDRHGRLIKQEVRYPDRPDGSKDIRQRRPGRNGEFIWNVTGCKPILYNLQYLDTAGVICICEGCKDADTVTDLCLSGARYAVVGTTSGGAATWNDELIRDIPKYKKVVILPDDDEPGVAYANAAERSVRSAGIDCRRVSFAGTNCKDVTEYVAHHSVEDLVRLIGPDWVRMPDGSRLPPSAVESTIGDRPNHRELA